MKRALLFSIGLMAIIGLSTGAWAQITINSSNFPAVGSSYHSYSTGDVNVNLGGGGANQTWDLSSYSYDDNGVSQIVDPASTSFGGDFPTATHAIGTSDSVSGWVYLRLTGSALSNLGFAGSAGGQDLIVQYDPVGTEAVFPMTYQTNWTSVSEYTILGALTIQDSIINNVDGWGTLITPAGSWSVLRIRQHTFNSTFIPQFPPQVTENYSYFFVAQDGFNGAEVTSTEGSARPDFTQGTISYSASALSAQPVRGPVANQFAVAQNYPNPFNPTTTLPVTLQKSGTVTLNVYDETGRLVSHEVMDLAAGSHDVSLNGSAWSSGNYFARVSAGNQSQTVAMQLLK